MTNTEKERLIFLLDNLLSNDLTEAEESEVFNEIDLLSPDPLWSEYIFHSDDYLNEDGSLNYAE